MPAVIKIPSLNIEILNRVWIHDVKEVDAHLTKIPSASGWVLPTLKEAQFMFSLSDLKGTIFADLRSGLRPSKIWLGAFYMQDTPDQTRMFFGETSSPDLGLTIGRSSSAPAQTILVRYPKDFGSKITLM